MKNIKIFAILLILALVNFTGCASKQYPKDVVAVINEKTITETDIQKKLTERKMAIAMGNQISSIERNSMTPREALIKALNVSEKDFTSNQIRYLESRERTSTKLLTNNEALNLLLREEVLYQQALKEGYKVSVEKAKQILEEANKASLKSLKDDKKAQEEYNKFIEDTEKIFNQYGFRSEEDYLNQRIDKTAQSATINEMKYQFDKVMTDKLPQANGLQMIIDKQNAWDDYSEYLLKKAKVQILNKDYSVELYGEPWVNGTLDLRNQSNHL